MRGVHEYSALESAGWKAGLGTAISASNEQGVFYQRLLADYAEKGEKGENIVFQYLIDGSLAASDLCLKRDGILYALKTTYDETLEGQSPALLMREAIMRQLFESGEIRVVEFYDRVMGWHHRFGVHTRPLYHLEYYSGGCLMSLANMARSIRTRIRRTLSPVTPSL